MVLFTDFSDMLDPWLERSVLLSSSACLGIFVYSFSHIPNLQHAFTVVCKLAYNKISILSLFWIIYAYVLLVTDASIMWVRGYNCNTNDWLVSCTDFAELMDYSAYRFFFFYSVLFFIIDAMLSINNATLKFILNLLIWAALPPRTLFCKHHTFWEWRVSQKASNLANTSFLFANLRSIESCGILNRLALRESPYSFIMLHILNF
jgi:hypothetical protein